MAQVIVIGAGITGILSAYYLAREGHEVTVIEREEAVADGASGANAGQLSFGSLYTLASPYAFRSGIKALYSDKGDIKLRTRTDMAFWSWAARFAYCCLPSQSRASKTALMDLSQESRQLYGQIFKEHNPQFSFGEAGRLRVYSSQEKYDKAQEEYKTYKDLYGTEYRNCTPDECVETDSILSAGKNRIYGGVIVPGDFKGDCAVFCEEMKRIMADEGMKVTFRMGEGVQSFERNGERVKAIKTDKGNRFDADVFLICAGAYTPLLLSQFGHNLPIYPIKGSSLYVPYSDQYSRESINHSIVLLSAGVVIAPFDKFLRISHGMVVDRYNSQPDKKTIQHMKGAVSDWMPGFDFTGAEIHTGFRPATPSSIPVTKQIGDSNLFVNAGHGMWGWTLGAVTARNIADIITKAA